MRFLDGGEQFIKINASAEDGFVDDGAVECSYFEMTDAGRPNVERSPGGCYTGGIDAHAARGWLVRDNRFTGIYCAGEGLAEHAVHFWRSSRDTVVENNVIVNCARGIGFGLDDTTERRAYPDDPYSGIRPIAHFDGIIRNNVIFADIDYYDTGIELARGARRARLPQHRRLGRGRRLLQLDRLPLRHDARRDPQQPHAPHHDAQWRDGRPRGEPRGHAARLLRGSRRARLPPSRRPRPTRSTWA